MKISSVYDTYGSVNIRVVVRRDVGPSGGGPAERRAFRWWSGRTSGLQVVILRNVGPSGGGPTERRAFRWWSGGGSGELWRWFGRTPAVVEEEQGGKSGLRSLS
ncbi:hypothetical protein M5K25_019526 [Dendrobium thyrsiflorum]|uniref:Uncharacterized protein n=1 Tax=Dendrobium thyrsiflorum TaxID=117978 RepID=A0ABD0UF00_DENTH